jgi:hypothetical protein
MKRATLFLSKIGSCSLEQRVCDDHMNKLLSESFISLGENAILMGSALLKGMKARVKTSQEGSLFCILSIRVRSQRRWLVLDQLWHRNWSSSKASGKFSACWKYLPNTGSLSIVIPTLEIVNWVRITKQSTVFNYILTYILLARLWQNCPGLQDNCNATIHCCNLICITKPNEGMVQDMKRKYMYVHLAYHIEYSGFKSNMTMLA